MNERGTHGFDAVEFLRYLRSRRRFVLICCCSAVLLALLVSVFLPRRYTATASILIGAPAGIDPRGATSVSPVYLESLKTFEHLASSDSLFLHALEHVGVRQKYAGRTVESLKRSVLQVNKPVSTRVIQISATLEDPAKAQALAQYIAEQTVALSRSIDSQFSGDVAKEAEVVFEKSGARLRAAEAASERAAKSVSTNALMADLDNTRQLQLRVEEDLENARADLAEVHSAQPGDKASDAPARARLANLEEQAHKLGQTIASLDAQLAIVKQRGEAVDAELEEARGSHESADKKLSEIRAAAAFRGERLDVFDPGIVPQRPSSPNVPLNLLLALMFSLLASVAFLVFRFGYEQASRATEERAWSLR
jgi:capsular polysaccharide biosynthesis protein